MAQVDIEKSLTNDSREYVSNGHLRLENNPVTIRKLIMLRCSYTVDKH